MVAVPMAFHHWHPATELDTGLIVMAKHCPFQIP